MLLNFFSESEQSTELLAAEIARSCLQLKSSYTIHLLGDLGAGKTCFSRGFIKALGHQGSVKSPTYTLVEPYDIDDYKVFHFDLYRLSDPEELEFMGFRDYLQANVISLIEWPSKGEGVLPSPDLKLNIEFVDSGRNIRAEALSENGTKLIQKLK